MIRIGMFPLNNLSTSFFDVCLPTIISRTKDLETADSYQTTWTTVFAALPSSAKRGFVSSLVSSIQVPSSSMDAISNEETSRRLVKAHACLLSTFIRLEGVDVTADETGGVLLSVVLERSWSEFIARVVVCWISEKLWSTSINENRSSFLK